MSACAACGAAEQPTGARFCHQCGSALESDCAQCSAALTPGARFCSSCGAPTSAANTPARAIAERRVTSVLFCDLVGFTTLAESRDHEETRELLTRYFDDARQIIGRYGGTVEKFIGDAVMAVWGVPISHEDDAERAVRAGLELVTRVTDMGEDVGVAGLAARVGVVTGEVAVTVGAEHQGMVAGDAVNTASRVQSVAGPGQVWVDETTRLLTSGAITYADAGSHQLKGKADPMPLWSARAVVAARGGAQRADGLEATLIGRERELRLVKELFHGVESTQRPALLLVDGEAGVGKTRLAWEFEKYADGLDTWVAWHTGRCLAYGEGVAFWAIAEAVRGRLSAAGDDPDADVGVLLDLTLDRYGVVADERDWMRPRLEVLLGTAAHRFAKEDLFSAWTTFFERISEGAHPVVLLIDDAQYAEDGLLEFVEHLMTWASCPLFVMMMTRPGLLERRVSLATHRSSTVIHLPGLDRDTMARLLDGLVSGLPEQARTELVERAEGLPLYAVETVRSLIDRDLVVPRGGVYVLAAADSLDLASLAAPASLQALLGARLDTLSADQRRVVSVASVLGTTLSRERIATLCPEVEDVDPVLTQLVHQQILAHQSSRLSSEFGHYTFQQTMFRQVAYATLSLRERKKIHLAVVDSYGPEADPSLDRAAVLAQHLLDAIEAVPGDADVPTLRAAAIDLLTRAANRARALGLPDEAVEHLRAALGHEDDPLARADLQARLGAALIDTGDYAQAAQTAQQSTEAFDAAGDELAAGLAAATWSRALAFLGQHEECQQVALPRWDRLHADPNATTTALALSGALISSGPANTWSDDMIEVLDIRARLGEKAGDVESLAVTFGWMGMRHLFSGATTLGLTLLQATAALGREHQLPGPLCRALVNLAAFAISDDAEKAVQLAQEARTVAQRTGARRLLSTAAANLAVAQFVRGEWDGVQQLITSENVQWEPGPDRQAVSVIDAVVARARGTQSLGQGYGFEGIEGDENQVPLGYDKGWLLLDEALKADRAGESAEALRLAVSATTEYGDLFDDFLHMWDLAMELALAGDDREVEAELLALIEGAPVVLPLGLRAHRARFGALIALRDDLAPAETEALLRHAVDLYTQWGALAYRARAQGELGGFLTHQGRADEAAPLLDEAREFLTSIDAQVWLEHLGLTAAQGAAATPLAH